MPQQCGLKTEEVVDNKRQTEQGLMTVKLMKNCSHQTYQIQNSELFSAKAAINRDQKNNNNKKNVLIASRLTR